MGTPVAADAPWSSSPQHACLTWTGGSTGPLLHSRQDCKTHTKAGVAHTRHEAERNAVGATRARKRTEALLHARVV
eukprot:scaffold93117_cov43-Phaeocystis_antarctica.AAC.2